MLTMHHTRPFARNMQEYFLRVALYFLSLSMLLVVFGAPAAFAQAKKCDPCTKIKANFDALSDAINKEKEFLDGLDAALQQALESMDYKAIRKAYLRKMVDQFRRFAASSDYRRMSGVRRIQWRKLRILKARQDLLAIRQMIRNLKEMRRRTGKYRASIAALESDLLKRAKKLADDCDKDPRTAARKAKALRLLLLKARRLLCRRQRSLLRGYEYAWMEAGLSPLGFGTLEQVAIHTRSRDVFGVTGKATHIFGPANAGYWKGGGFGGHVEKISNALQHLQVVLQVRFGSSVPKKCIFHKVTEFSYAGQDCPKPRIREGERILVATPGDVMEVVTRDKAVCVGLVMQRVRITEPGALLVSEKPPVQEMPPQAPPREEEPLGETTLPPEKPVPPSREKKPGPSPKEKEELIKYLEKILKNPEKFIKLPPDTPREGTREREKPPELGLVKAKKQVVDLVVKNGYTGKPVPGAVIKLADAAPALPDEKEVVNFDNEDVIRAMDASMAEMAELAQASRDATIARKIIFVLQKWRERVLLRPFDIMHAYELLDRPLNERVMATWDEIWQQIEQDLQKDAGQSRDSARNLVNSIKKKTLESHRKRYEERVSGGQTDEQGKSRFQIRARLDKARWKFDDQFEENGKTSEGVRAGLRYGWGGGKVIYKPRKQKVLLLPGKTKRKTIEEISKSPTQN